jgi:copper chaperone CopZ
MLSWCFLGPAIAETSRERVALSLSGENCSSQRHRISAALAQVPGVAGIDLDSVPDHALVDIESGVVTPDQVRASVAQALQAGTQCGAEIMKSCITASLPPSHR